VSRSALDALEDAGLPVRVLDPAPSAGGNEVLLVGPAGEERVLKVYRRRRAFVRAPFRALENRWLGKRSISPAGRCETERLTLDLWERSGVRAPRRIEAPLPPGVDPPALWMEYCPGPTLFDALRAADAADGRARWGPTLREYGAATSRRHDIALERREVLLVPEHAGAKHVLLSRGEQVHVDHETGWGPRVELEAALRAEVTMVVRSLLRAAAPWGAAAVGAWVAGYAEGRRLRALVVQALRGGGMSGALHRWHDRLTRRDLTKARGLEVALAALDATPPAEGP